MKKLLINLLLLVPFFAAAQHMKPIFNPQANFPKGGWYGDLMATQLNFTGSESENPSVGLSNVKGKTGFGLGIGRFNYFVGGIVIDYMSYGLKYSQYSAKADFNGDGVSWSYQSGRFEIDLGKEIQPWNYFMFLPYVKLETDYTISSGDSLGIAVLQGVEPKGDLDLRAAIGLGMAYKFNGEWLVMPYGHYYFFRDQGDLLNDVDAIASQWIQWEVGVKFLWHKPKSGVTCDIPKDKVNLNRKGRKRKVKLY
ncbi:MAG: hypothetical protein ACI9YL_001183 [Luteibaculaceae bacterium]|jgi:hypothetical protein